MDCKYCESKCIKQGFQKNGYQKYRCTDCKKYQQSQYQYKAYDITLNKSIIKQVQRGCGVRDIAYILGISSTTVIDRIRYISSVIQVPLYTDRFQEYEMDEICTNIWLNNRKKQVYIGYAINTTADTKIDFTIGGRDSETLGKVVNKMLLNYPKEIRTDRLSTYSSIIPKDIHVNRKYKINKIERSNLTMRTRLKRLSRNPFCQSKKYDMLEACLKIYFWG